MIETEFKKPTKPEFTKPTMPEISTAKDGKFDITKEMDSEEIDKFKAAMGVKHFKYFYDNLVKSMENYSNAIEANIVTPLSSTIDTIGTKTDRMDTQIGDIEARVEAFDIAG